jgi:hypothetical protein
MFEKMLAYYRDNPEGYWFKRKLYGWGWMPVRWQGWFVLIVSVAFIVLGVYVGDSDDAPGAALLGIVIAAALIFGFGFWKGEKLRWQWGIPKDKE